MSIYRPKGRAGEYSEWAINLYGGCIHHCLYCYVPLIRKIDRATFYEKIYAYKDIIKKIPDAAMKFKGEITSPVMLSFTSDPYQPYAIESGITRQCIMALKQAGLNVCILSKGGTRTLSDLDLLGPGDIMAASLTMTNEASRNKWEKDASSYADRIHALRVSRDHGLETWASLEPVIYPDQTLDIIDDTKDFVDLYKIGTINYCKPISGKIDWVTFALTATNKIRTNGNAYYMKDDLHAFIPEVKKIHNPNGVCIMHSS